MSDEEGEITLSAINSALKNAGINRKLDADTLDKLNSPESNVRLKNHTGGPAPEAVSKTIETIAAKINVHKAWLANATDRINKAKEELEEIKKEIGFYF